MRPSPLRSETADQVGSVVEGRLEPGMDGDPCDRCLRPLLLVDLRGPGDEVTEHGVIGLGPGRVGLDAASQRFDAFLAIHVAVDALAPQRYGGTVVVVVEVAHPTIFLG